MNPNLLEIGENLFSTSSWKTMFGRKSAERMGGPIPSSFLAGSSYSFLLVNIFWQLLTKNPFPTEMFIGSRECGSESKYVCDFDYETALGPTSRVGLI